MMPAKECDYCGNPILVDAAKCDHCGGINKQNTQPTEQRERVDYTTFFHQGYMIRGRYTVWMGEQRSWHYDRCTWYFWLGDTLVDIITVDKDVIKRFVDEGHDAFDFVWKLFMLSQGEEEVLTVSERNKRNPAMFEIRRVPNDRETWLVGLTIEDVLDASRKFNVKDFVEEDHII